jgi:hypothetical protein
VYAKFNWIVEDDNRCRGLTKKLNTSNNGGAPRIGDPGFKKETELGKTIVEKIKLKVVGTRQ